MNRTSPTVPPYQPGVGSGSSAARAIPPASRRNRISWVLAGLILIFDARPSHAFLDAIITAADRAREELYEKFMMAKAVEQVKNLRDNYAASMRYYNYYKQMNQGKGIIGNFTQNIADIGNQTVYDAHQQFQDDWIRDQGYRSNVEATFQKMDRYSSQKVLYAGKVFDTAVKGQQEGQKLAAAAATMDPQSPQRAIVQGQAWTVQLQAQSNANLAELIDLNTRMYELQLENKKQDLMEWSIFQNSANKVLDRAKDQVTPSNWFNKNGNSNSPGN